MDYSVAVPAARTAPGKFASRLARFLAARATIGAVCESSRWLGQRMAEAALGTDLPIVELGAGFGAVTRFLPETAISIERDAERFNFLKHTFPERPVIDTCAIAFLDELTQPTIVVSSIPIVNNPEFGALRDSFARAAAAGTIDKLILYTYFPINPLADVFANSAMIGYEVRNLPPAFLWRYSC